MQCSDERPFDLSGNSLDSVSIENVQDSDDLKEPSVSLLDTVYQGSAVESMNPSEDIEKSEFFKETMIKSGCGLKIPKSKIPSPKEGLRTEFQIKEPSFLMSNILLRNCHENEAITLAENTCLEQHGVMENNETNLLNASQVCGQDNSYVSKNTIRNQVFQKMAAEKARNHPLFVFPKENTVINFEKYQQIEEVCGLIYKQLYEATLPCNLSIGQTDEPNLGVLPEQAFNTLSSSTVNIVEEQNCNISNESLSRYLGLYQENKKVYECLVCSAFCSNLAEEVLSHILKDRILQDDKEEWIVNNGSSIICSACSYKTDSNRLFERHKRAVGHLKLLGHYKHIKEGNMQNEFQTENALSKYFIRIQCNVCDYMTTTVHKFKLHIKSTHHISKTQHYLDFSSDPQHFLNQLQNNNFDGGKSSLGEYEGLKLSQSVGKLQEIENGSNSIELSRSGEADAPIGGAMSISMDKLRDTCCDQSGVIEDINDDNSFQSNSGTSFLDQIMIGRKTLGNQTVFACPFCNFYRTSKLVVRVHVLEHSKLLSELDCSLCFLGFNEKGSLDRHVREFHVTNSPESVTDRQKNETNVSSPIDRTVEQNGNQEVADVPLEFIFHKLSKLKAFIKHLSTGKNNFYIKERNREVSDTTFNIQRNCQKWNRTRFNTKLFKDKKNSGKKYSKSKKPKKSDCCVSKQSGLQNHLPAFQQQDMCPTWNSYPTMSNFGLPNHIKDNPVYPNFMHFSQFPGSHMAMPYCSYFHVPIPPFAYSPTTVANYGAEVTLQRPWSFL